MTEAWLRGELERIHAHLRAEDRKRRRAEREADTRAAVAAYLAEHPDASASVVAREIGRRKQEVLQAVAEHKTRFPTAGNRQESGGRE